MKKVLLYAQIAALLLTLCACSNTTDVSCNHNYYLSDYTEATSTANGSKRYTCSNCGHSYTEIIPATQEKTDQHSDETDLTRKKSVNLFDYPIYSENSGGVTNLLYESEITDVDGWKHNDCYHFFGSKNRDEWVRYEISGKYSTIKGKIFDANSAGGAGWLEFYDGEDFLAATEKIGDGVTSIEFEIDITGVEYLTVYFCSTQAGTWMIADDVMMYK